MLSLLILGSSVLFADNNTDILEKFSIAENAYQKQQYHDSIKMLKELIELIKTENAHAYEYLLPPESQFWDKTETNLSYGDKQLSSLLDGLQSDLTIQLAATYISKKSQSKIHMEITNTTHEIQMSQSQIEMYFNPVFQKAMPESKNSSKEEIEKINIHEFTAFLSSNNHKPTLHIFCGKLMVKITVLTNFQRDEVIELAHLIPWEQMRLIDGVEAQTVADESKYKDFKTPDFSQLPSTTK